MLPNACGPPVVPPAPGSVASATLPFPPTHNIQNTPAATSWMNVLNPIVGMYNLGFDGFGRQQGFVGAAGTVGACGASSIVPTTLPVLPPSPYAHLVYQQQAGSPSQQQPASLHQQPPAPPLITAGASAAAMSSSQQAKAAGASAFACTIQNSISGAAAGCTSTYSTLALNNPVISSQTNSVTSPEVGPIISSSSSSSTPFSQYQQQSLFTTSVITSNITTSNTCSTLPTHISNNSSSSSIVSSFSLSSSTASSDDSNIVTDSTQCNNSRRQTDQTPQKTSFTADATGGWTEHVSKDGRKFYYNVKLQKSQWDKPDELKTEEELKLSKETEWKEYTTADGRTYWYNKNSNLSTWEMPKEIVLLKSKLKIDEEKADDDKQWKRFDNKMEARQHLTTLFELKKFPPKTKWEDALKILEADKRWNSLSILTKGEKKQHYSEYISLAQKRNLEDERKKRQQARESVLEALAKYTDLKPTSKYCDFAETFYKEEWWKWIDEKEKDDLFQDYVEEFLKKQKEQKRKKRKELYDLLKQKFAEHSDLTSLAKWKESKHIYEEDPKFSLLDKVDFFNVWEEYALELEKHEKDEMRKNTYRLGRVRRDAFRDLLKELIEEEKFHAKTDWLTIIKIIKNDNRYTDMLGQPGSTPREIFEDKREELLEEYYSQATIFKNCIKQAGLLITSATTFPWIYESLRPQEEMNKVSIINCKLAFYSLLQRVAEKERVACRRYSKNVKKATYNLTTMPNITPHMTNEEIIEQLKITSKYGSFVELCATTEQQKLAIDKYRIKILRDHGTDENARVPDAFVSSDSDDDGGGGSGSSRRRRRDLPESGLSDSKRSHHHRMSRDANGHRSKRKNAYKSDSESDNSRYHKQQKKHSKYKR